MRTRKEGGQGMTEYIILVALIAVVCIAAVKMFGGKTKDGFDEASDHVAGITKVMEKEKK